MLGVGETLTYGRIRIEVHDSTAADAIDAPGGSQPLDADARREQRAVPASVQKARAREAKWYDTHV